MTSHGKMVRTIIQFSPALRSRAEAFCKKSEAGLSLAALIRQALVEKLDREASKTPRRTK